MKEKRKALPWLLTGAAVSLAFGLLFLSRLSWFRSQAEAQMTNPVTSAENIQTLYQFNQILYRNYYNFRNASGLSYTDLYYPIDAGSPVDQLLQGQYRADDAEDDSEYPEEYSDGSASYADADLLLNSFNDALLNLSDYFSGLESSFSALSIIYDYWIGPPDGDAVLTNSGTASFPSDGSPYYLLLEFDFDENGYSSVGAATVNDSYTIAGTSEAYDAYTAGNDFFTMEPARGTSADSETVFRYASQLTGDFALPSDSVITYENLSMEIFNRYTHETPIRNCRIVYGLRLSTWEKMHRFSGGLSLQYGAYTNLYREQYSGFMRAGVDRFYVLACLAVLLCAFLPFVPKFPAVPGYAAEIAAALLLGLLASVHYVILMLSGASGRLLSIGAAAVYLSLLSFLFFLAWCAGSLLRPVWRLGLRGYLREHSSVFRIFPFAYSKALGFYQTLTHLDVTRPVHMIILRLIAANAVLMLISRFLWSKALPFIAAYSVILYFILKKYAGDLQEQYRQILVATNEIANGNLDVSITADLGIFEPFKQQITRIQQGFRRAVDEEIKSQRMKTELITNVSHDLKTPLTAIITYIGLLKDKETTAEQRIKYLDTLETKALRLKVLIEDLFEISKATSRTVQLNIMDVDILNLVRQVAIEMSDQLTAARLDMRMNLPEQKVILPLDSQKTYRIYENLFGNIAKYALAGTRVYVTGTVADGELTVTLKNISADELHVNPSELTDRFVRGDASRNTEGSGLGLAIAKSFTELQGGRLEIQLDDDLFKVSTVWRIPDSGAETQQQPEPFVHM